MGQEAVQDFQIFEGNRKQNCKKVLTAFARPSPAEQKDAETCGGSIQSKEWHGPGGYSNLTRSG